ncbi:MAG: vWA domain-containing protein [Verrucomicrobiota bacterium]|nr:vWA domain-containing protein [Verrucomicrobiota bacterium]
MLFLFIFLNPYYKYSKPDKETFTIAVLADCSGSMGIADCDGKKRLEILKKLVGQENSWLSTWNSQKNYQLRKFSFSNKLSFLSKTDPSLLPGNTAIGENMTSIINEFANESTPGALILFSDGTENFGKNATDVAKIYSKKEIPVTCIGIGGKNLPEDISVNFTKIPKKTAKGIPTKIQVEIKSTFKKESSISIQLKESGVLINQKTIRIANSKEKLSFLFTPTHAGLNELLIEAHSTNKESIMENNFDFTSIKVTEPPVQQILYLSPYFSPEYKFLQRLCHKNKGLELSAIIRSSKTNTAYRYNIEEKTIKKKKSLFQFPQEYLTQYDVIIADLNITSFLSEKDIEKIKIFVEKRGGGLLFTGKYNKNSPFNTLLPIKQEKTTEQINKSPKNISFPDFSQLFSQNNSNEINTASPKKGLLAIPAETVFFTNKYLKRGAKPIIQINSILPVAAIQNYGAGRTAWLGTKNTWNWYLNSDAQKTSYTTFWKKLLRWLASTSQKRIQCQFNNKKLELGNPIKLNTKIFDIGFKPDSNSTVEISIKSPKGEKYSSILSASRKIVGTYSGTFIPRETGKYEFNLTAQHQDLPPKKLQGAFIAVKKGPEFKKLTPNYSLLKDVARISAGKYLHYKNINSLKNLKLSKNLPMIAKRIYPFQKIFFMLLLLFLLLTECFLRRRIGLK